MPSLVRILLSAGLLLSFSPAMAALVIDAVPAGSRSDQNLPIHFIQYDDPCTDGRYSDGQPLTAGSSCACWTAGSVIGNGTTITGANATIPASMAGLAMAVRAVAGQ
ncbi:hypothetical protein [Mesorhizobium sp. B2-7-3]|uniref:hypothetical protein n=1 Tax=Mesorhizobium sp. B2-7-3 TaxID=2589907 RepID=UPI001129E8FA|nr:hypothetical protein [Mesorhizobium sp. B2-7-3]